MISVIVPIYKVEPYLQQCVDSILNQTYRDLEVLLIDDGLPDKCGEICDEYERKDKRVRVFHTENRGLSAARNLGLKEARGEYIGFVDSDDWIELDMYEMLLRRMQKVGADISICGFWRETNKHIIMTTKLKETVYKGDESLLALVEGKIQNCVWNNLYRRVTLEKISFPKGKDYEDIACIHKVIHETSQIAIFATPKYHYRIRDNSITNDYSAKHLFEYADAYLKRYYYCLHEARDVFSERPELLLQTAAIGISKVWRWWYGCCACEKMLYYGKLKELEVFSREHFPLLGCSTWPWYLRLTSLFMHSSNPFLLSILYWLNQSYRVAKSYRASTHRYRLL